MSLSSLLCVYLISCYSSPKTELTDNCPHYCSCYKAPEEIDDKYGKDTSVTLECNLINFRALNQVQFAYLPMDYSSINTLFIENVDGLEQIPERMLSGLRISNLICKRCTLNNVYPGIFTTEEISLQVLTFIETTFGEGADGGFSWDMFQYQDQLKSIELSKGYLDSIDKMFSDGTLSVKNVISLTVDSTGLKTIDKNALKNFHSLKILKITGNPIDRIDWIMKIASTSIWDLDLRDNQIKDFPLEVANKFDKLKILKLGGNRIHVLPVETFQKLLSLREFSLQPIEGVNSNKKQYFYPTEDMKWLYDVYKDNYDKLPRFFRESMRDYQCVMEWDRPGLKMCDSLRSTDYDYPQLVASEHMTTLFHSNAYHLSYRNSQVKLSGAVLPFEWSGADVDLKKWIDKIRDGHQTANVIRFYLNMHPWFTTRQDNADEFEEMIKELENDLKLAEENNMFVIINLWKASKLPREFLDERILPVYLENHLRQLVERLSPFSSLAAWDLFEEPENLVLSNMNNGDPCLDTNNIRNDHGSFEIKRIQSFLAIQAQIIHSINPRKLVTTTLGESYAFNDNRNGFNIFENQCLCKSLSDNCPNDDYALDFYSVLINNGNAKHRQSFLPKDLSHISPKPIMIVADSNPTLVKNIVQDYAEDYWKFEGLLGTFVKDINAGKNGEITVAINRYSEGNSASILGPNDENLETTSTRGT